MKFIYESVLRKHYVLLATFLLFFVAACEDNDDPKEKHTDAEGFLLESNGTEVYKEFKGTQLGSLSLSVGDTLDFTVHFLGDDGKELAHEEENDHGDDESELVISGFNNDIMSAEYEEGHDDGNGEGNGDGHDDDEEEHGMAIEVIGLSAGSTSFKLVLMHDGHADYTSTNNVPVVVK